MNKILIPIALVVAAYLIYGQLTSSDLESDIVKADDNPEITEAMKKGEEPIPFVPDVVVPDVDTDPLVGKYIAEIDNDTVTATIEVEILPDMQIKHHRYINRNGEISEASVSGNYTVTGNRLTFDFPEERNKDIFKFEQLILDVKDGGNLVSGRVSFNKQ